jgi:pimeloyl-ACP methyl ester carboxylesterase
MKPLMRTWVCLCLGTIGCAESQPYVSSWRMERGLVLVLPGIEGPSPFNREICRGLDEGGVDCAIETYDWTSSLGPLYNLRAMARNRRQAERVADLVVRYHAACPGRPVFLVGQSGGGAIAVWAAELLPPEHKVDGIILLAASLSPYYMLDAAIQNSRRGVVSFHSHRDWFLLGTNVTGTMDGELSSSAGRTGFLYPQDSPKPRSYARLYQVPWDRQMGRAGNTGGHLTSGASGFVARYVAPLIRLGTWEEESVGAVMANGNEMHPGAIEPLAHLGSPGTAPAVHGVPAAVPSPQGPPPPPPPGAAPGPRPAPTWD